LATLVRVGPSILVLLLASAIRFPNYDVAWFGIDQVYFLSEARRILAGATDVVGPLSSGLNLLGPVYSYLLAGLLSIRNDATFLGVFGAACEVAGAWLVFDTGRRMAGTTAGGMAALLYAVSPITVLSTRLIWNPSLLPMMVAFGWWMAVRYAEAPTLARLVGTALVAGLMLPLHPTGIFPAAGVVGAALLSRVPPLQQLAAAAIAGLLPLVPTLVRLTRRTGDVGTLGTLFTFPSDFFSTIGAIVTLYLGFPARLAPDDRSATIAAAGLYVLAALATIGALRRMWVADRQRRIWIALVVTCVVYLVAAAIYSGGLTWYYLLAFVPMCALLVAGALGALPSRVQPAGVAVVIACALAQVVFLARFDVAARDSGLLHINSARLMIRRPPGEAYSLTMREVRTISHDAAGIVPDGATALMSVHGIRGELWRESGAEFMPWAAAPRSERRVQFTVVGRGAAPLKEDAHLLGAAVCATERDEIVWRLQHRALPGWETPQFSEEQWLPLELPRRTEAPSLAADDPRFASWRSGRVVLRGRYAVRTTGRRRLVAVTAHSPPGNPVSLTEIFINSVAVTPAKARVMYGIYLNQEWLLDVTDRVTLGENLIALGFASPVNTFDLDVFEVPCSDREFYF
jgi:uncharacterized membrane protein (UPF0136 family)